MLKNWLIAVFCPCVCGSKKVAKPRPMLMPMSCPAMPIAAKTSLMLNPMASPMMSCWTKIRRPCRENISNVGMVGRVGMMTNVNIKPMPNLMRIGMDLSLNIGAVAITPSTLVNGQSKAIIQVLMSSLLMDTMLLDGCYFAIAGRLVKTKCM